MVSFLRFISSFDRSSGFYLRGYLSADVCELQRLIITAAFDLGSSERGLKAGVSAGGADRSGLCNTDCDGGGGGDGSGGGGHTDVWIIILG